MSAARHNVRDARGRFVPAPATLWRRAQDAEATERSRPLGEGTRPAWRGRDLGFSAAYWRVQYAAIALFCLFLICQ